MITVSLCMIVRNESEVLARCLDCAKQVVDEIIIVDTGSEDNTREIARQYTDMIYDFSWCDDFSAARNASFSRATKDYILWLDADDVIDDENIRRFLALKENLSPDVDVCMFPYHIAFDASGRCTFSYYRERMVKREKEFSWKEPVHEYLEASGVFRRCDVVIRHGEKKRTHSSRNLDIYEARIKAGEQLSARGMYYYARELKTHGRINHAIEQYQAFLDRSDAWVGDVLTASADLSDCFAALGDNEKALNVLFSSFSRDLPRAEILCRIAKIFKTKNDFRKAIFWYDFALQVPRPDDSSFISEDYWGYIPHMELCVLCDKTGDRESAVRHHLEAKKLKPDDAAVLHNERWFFLDRK